MGNAECGMEEKTVTRAGDSADRNSQFASIGPVGFDPRAIDTGSAARAGVLHTPHGEVETPAFMPVGTQGTVKGVLPSLLRDCGTRMLLANTYHLALRPGE